MITAISAALLALLFLFLSFRIIKLRLEAQVSLGHGGHAKLKRAIRAHANFAEYTPFCIILLFLLEMIVGHSLLVIAMAVCLTLGRMLHAYGISQPKENLRFRQSGMVLTFLAMLVTSIALFSYSVGSVLPS